ncbi:MIP/aquaporin family protein [Buchnera aphidicola]|uniref:MIP/aquaporin family protein n=1 Tax=Buchnera aphidicola TaxID=9 RepID=UPI003464D073
MNIYNKNNIIKQCLAEFFGTGLIILFGLNATVLSKLSNYNINYLDISIIWSIGVSISIYSSLFISGAHLNPAITIFLWSISEFNKKKVLPYIFSQILGSFFFTMIIYCIYRNILIVFERTHKIVRGTQESLDLASIFCVYPKINTLFLYDFIAEVMTSIIFMIVIMLLRHKKKYLLTYSYLSPILVGILIFFINISIGSYYNITLNPARDIGPRVFLSFIGWGSLSFTGGTNIPYFFIPLLGPIIGINIGGWLYKKLIIKN